MVIEISFVLFKLHDNYMHKPEEEKRFSVVVSQPLN